MEEEIWKDIPEYEGIYQCSSFGRVKSLTRMRAGRVGFMRIQKEKILSTSSNGLQYLSVSLYKNRLVKYMKVHQLVAIVFLGHIQDGHKLVVNHIDGNKFNNHVWNLEIVTSRDNRSICFRKNNDKFTSKFIGVSWHDPSKKWRAHIHYEGKQRHLGCFVNEKDASNAYQTALSELARFNAQGIRN